MKAWMKSLLERFGELTIKLVSVKGLFAAIATVNFLFEKSSLSIGIGAMAWGLLIGGRQVDKILDTIKAVKGGQ